MAGKKVAKEEKKREKEEEKVRASRVRPVVARKKKGGHDLRKESHQGEKRGVSNGVRKI